MRYGAGGAGGGVPRPPPVPNVSPFGSTTRLRRPTGAPFLTGCSVTVTSSPNLNDVRAQPSRVMSVGLLTSTAQFRTPPVSSLASNFRKPRRRRRRQVSASQSAPLDRHTIAYFHADRIGFPTKNAGFAPRRGRYFC